MTAIIAALLLQAATPSPEAEALGRRLAENGTLAAMLPLVSAKETEELVTAQAELSAAEKDELRTTARAIAAKGIDTLLAAEGHAFAAALSLDDLRQLVAAAQSEAAKRQRAAMPRVIASTMQAAGSVDFKGETLAAFCAKTGKACPTKK